jgi:pyruvate formate lyase activating enzyme
MQFGVVSNIQKYSIQDGPGIRTTVFLKGCPLDCWWCHNPEGRSPKFEIVVVETRCIRCGECVKACPHACSPAVPCELCGACVEACPTGARQAVGKRISVDDVFAEIVKDGIFYDESAGGVTFSGGEPLMQPHFLKGLLEKCRSKGIHTAIDTCGYAPAETLMALAPLVDLFLYDLKLMEEARHIEYTGVSNRLILENLKSLGQVHDNIWIRIPIIPGVNDTEDQLEALARFAASIPVVRRVNLLPYHTTGVAKFRRLGQAYRLADVRPPSAGFMEAAVEKFRAFGLKTTSGG